MGANHSNHHETRGPHRFSHVPPGKRYARIVAQDWKCAMCHRDFSHGGIRCHQDHDHATGKPRDVICARCNILLGLADDDISILLLAVAYLKKHGKEGPDDA